jgi:rod shape-determining protein MreC
MALLDIRQRSGYLFLAVMLGHVLLISSQVNAPNGVPVLEAFLFGMFAEVQRGVSTAVSSVGDVWSGYVGLRRVKVENDDLRRQLAAAEIRIQEQRALADRTRSLERLLDLRDRSNLKTMPSEVIAAGASPDFRTLTIDKGSRDGLRADMAVIVPAGVVGRIVVPTSRAAKVQLLIDRNAAAGAIVERSRAAGVVVGRGDNRLDLQYVSEVSDIAVGDTVVTSGIDGIFPKGFVIGQVESIDRSGGAYKRIVVIPAVDFTGLEEVLVVLTPTPARELIGGGGE